MEAQERWRQEDVLSEVRRGDHFDEGTVHVDCGGNHMTLHMGQNCVEINKHFQMECK